MLRAANLQSLISEGLDSFKQAKVRGTGSIVTPCA